MSRQQQHEPGRAAVVGYGNVGRLFGGLLAGAGWHITAVDPHPPAEPHAPVEHGAPRGPDIVRADICAPPDELRQILAGVDMVIVSVPERAALAAVDVLDACVGAEATVVETLSHKHRFRQAAAERLAPRPLVSLNPLFHPSLGWAGNTVTASVDRGGPAAARLLDLIGGTGARVHTLDPDDHDRYVTSVQAVTHAAVLGFARALPRLGLPPTDVIACAPPPTRALLAMAARVLTADAETYWDIQSSGEPGDTARQALLASIEDLDHQVGTGDDADFREEFARLRDWFGDDLDGFADDAAHVLGALVSRRAPTHQPPTHAPTRGAT
ncbi:prephenate dehydrogenase/arogenate dehydrogenase family protein [Nocardiopsis gilva YIM 90087]|uniref:Prephenate dehydrogenase/arogenate dehydrogenase family protein n=1 Tax=Nocardiopsis gilva YIM 90087 TaxID=1235441 RepID=A0A223SA39_9ACTN|nr:prephenate dehydrogenase/arogenate dehydrogenase family protein [Nocardiopsis gilva]ASU84916.1 prephenate dehydrogenase/arogenate dehydrogenase family protein [Nocardiopsis gilva YIM 90087]